MDVQVSNQRNISKVLSQLELFLQKTISRGNKKYSKWQILKQIHEYINEQPSSTKANNDLSCKSDLKINQPNLQAVNISNDAEINLLKQKIKIEKQMAQTFLKKVIAKNTWQKPRSLSNSRINQNVAFPQVISKQSYKINKQNGEFHLSQQVCQGQSIQAFSDKKTFRGKGHQQYAHSAKKTLAGLRRLQMHILQQSRKSQSKKKKRQIILEHRSPSKKLLQEENYNLKAIQSNLLTHLQLLQKYRDFPQAESLLKRQKIIVRKQNALRELENALQKRQISLNKKEATILKTQKKNSFFNL